MNISEMVFYLYNVNVQCCLYIVISRPFALLTTHYKCLSISLLSILSSTQNIRHYIPDRSIKDKIFLVHNILDFCKVSGMADVLISLDQWKSFDSVGHNFVFNAIKSFWSLKLIFQLGTAVVYWCNIYDQNLRWVEPDNFSYNRKVCLLLGELYSIAIQLLLFYLSGRLSGFHIHICSWFRVQGCAICLF